MFYNLFSEKNTPYFVFIFGLLIVVLVVALFVIQFMFQKKISTRSIEIVSRIETDAVTNEESVKMTISNTGFHSVEIRGFGFKHKNRDFDYLRCYKEERDIPAYQKIVISPRDSLEIVIDLNELKAKLNLRHIGKFRAYVIDVYGNYILMKAKDVKKFIELYFAHLEYIEKVRRMPKEKQDKYLQKEKMYEERKKKILDHTIADSFEKADIQGENVKADNVIKNDEVKEEIKEEVKEEVTEVTSNEEAVEEKEEKNDKYIFNFDDSFSDSIQDELDEKKEEDEE